MTVEKRIPLGPDYHAEPGETKGHQHDVYTTKGELHGYTRIHVGTLMKSAVEDLATSLIGVGHRGGASRKMAAEQLNAAILSQCDSPRICSVSGRVKKGIRCGPCEYKLLLSNFGLSLKDMNEEMARR